LRVERYRHHEQKCPFDSNPCTATEVTPLISFGCCLYKRMTHYILFSPFGKHFFLCRKNEVAAFHTTITYKNQSNHYQHSIPQGEKKKLWCISNFPKSSNQSQILWQALFCARFSDKPLSLYINKNFSETFV